MSFVLILLMGSVLGPGHSLKDGLRLPVHSEPGPMKQAPQGPLLVRTGHVNDYAHALDDDTRAQVEQALIELKNRAKIDFAVALVKTTNGKPIVEYSKAVLRDWNPASADGLLLLLAIDDQQWHLQATRGLTRDLSAEKIKEVGTLMNPSLGQEHYGDGVRRGVEAIIKILAAKHGFAPISLPAPLLPR